MFNNHIGLIFKAFLYICCNEAMSITDLHVLQFSIGWKLTYLKMPIFI